jgi:hypothetical protein
MAQGEAVNPLESTDGSTVDVKNGRLSVEDCQLAMLERIADQLDLLIVLIKGIAS